MNKEKKIEIMRMLIELETPVRELTKWEQNFYESIVDQFDRHGSLSPKQLGVLERIYEERMS